MVRLNGSMSKRRLFARPSLEAEVAELRQRVAELEAREQVARLADAHGINFRDILDHARSAIYVFKPDYIILYANQEAAALTGSSISEMIGRDMRELVAPGELAHATRMRDQVAAGQKVPPYERTGLRADGTPVQLEISLSAVFDAAGEPVYFYTFARDITERKQSQETVRKLSLAVEHSPLAIEITNRDGVIEYVNPRYLEITGYTREEVIGQNPRFLKSGDTSGKAYREMVRAIQIGNTWRGEFLNKRKNGELYWEETTISPLLDERRNIITHFVAIKEDITQRKAAEAERENLIAELDAFAHTVAHDIQAPLQIVYGFAEMLREQDATLDEQVRQLTLRHVAQNTLKISSIVSELLLLARVRQDEDVPRGILDMDALVGDALRRITHLSEQYKPTFSLPDQWPGAMGYGPWIEEVWVNYLSNAIKYGGRPPQITVRAEPQPDGLIRFEVRDNGPGIPPDDVGQLFKPFTRLNGLRMSGEGLGLSITRRIVERLGGQVGVDSQIGQGSAFWFTLPADSNQ